MKTYKSMISLLMLVGLSVTTANATPEGIVPHQVAMWVRKAAIHVRGYALSRDEWQEVTELYQAKRNQQEFRSAVADKLLEGDGFERKFLRTLYETFRFRADPERFSAFEGVFSPRTVLERLLSKVVSENRSLDDMLTLPLQVEDLVEPQRSRFSDNRQAEEEFGFYRHLRAESDPFQRVNSAGVLSSWEFMTRYPTNPTNMNFGRARHVLRIFLCNDLNPIFLSDESADEVRTILALQGLTPQAPARAQSGRQSPAPARAQSPSQRHASEPSCRECHQYLDDVASMYTTSQARPSRVGGYGALVTGPSGSVQRTETVGLSQLAQAIVRSPEYASCQSKRLWEQYIGTDVPLNDERSRQALGLFESNGRRVKDVVKALLLRPEFDPAQSVEQVVTSHEVLPIFARCHQCHQSERVSNPPPLMELPTHQQSVDQFWLKTIAEEMDLKNRGRRPSMPPRHGRYRLSRTEVESVMRWYYAGAPDHLGRTSLSEQFARELLPRDYQPNIQMAGVNKRFRRLLGGSDLLLSGSIFRRNLGIEPIDSGNSQCSTETVLRSIGEVSTINGRPLSERLSSELIQWARNCVQNRLYTIFGGGGEGEAVMSAVLARLSGDDLLEKRSGGNRYYQARIHIGSYWSDLTDGARREVVDQTFGRAFPVSHVGAEARSRLVDELLQKYSTGSWMGRRLGNVVEDTLFTLMFSNENLVY